ncbi:MAG TPA: peptide chain release factor N(5)-glutamine methyltransferase [Pirellulales bacterium]|jgi:release factor glutamine methyltransferase|nr:peptide chain release factor N(5)-glutamine methyltransferase [Pirellulales bacterium]
MPQPETWTIGRLLQWTTQYLKQHAADSPRLDAEVLLAESLGCQRIQLYTRFDEVPGEQTRTAFRELVRRRAEGMPVAYLVGRREFYSLSFRVTPDVLIPRPETEFVVIRLLDLAQPADAERTIADVGTGSGVIAVCAAKWLPACRVVALDVRQEALDVAAANAKDYGLTDRIELVNSDLFAAVAPERTFDFVVSNPPYVADGELAGLSRDVRDHEPRQALVAGPSGTEVIARLVEQAGQRLKPGGWLLMEISPQIEGAVRELVAHDPRFELGSTVKDLAGLARVIQAQRKQ